MYIKGLEVIISCKTIKQLDISLNYINIAFDKKYIDYSGYILLYDIYLDTYSKINKE